MNIVVLKKTLVHLALAILIAYELFFALSLRLETKLQNTIRPPACPSNEGQSCILICGRQPPRVHIGMIDISSAILF